MGEKGKAYIQWRISSRLSNVEENVASLYVQEMEEHPAIFEQINETAKKFNLALTYAKQGSDDLAMIQIKKVLSLTPNFVRGHLLFALLHMRAGDNEEAKNDLNNALAVDNYNTTARRYLIEIGEGRIPTLDEIPTQIRTKDNDNLKNVRPVDHYEDPNKETWKQFVYMLIGLAIGVIVMFVLVIPSVRAGVSVDYNNLKKEYKETVNKKDAEIAELQNERESLEKKNKSLNKSLSVYEGQDGKDSMYDSLLKALQAYDEDDYEECADELSKIDSNLLPSETSKKIYTTMKENASPKAASQLYESGKELYDTYKYEEAKKDLEASYKYEKSYETLYLVAMCYKRLGDTETAYPYLYDIINNCGDEDLIRRAANYGLDLQKKDAIEEAAKHKDDDKKDDKDNKDNKDNKDDENKDNNNDNNNENSENNN
jgi:Tfp pilus assembly protein PilF